MKTIEKITLLVAGSGLVVFATAYHLASTAKKVVPANIVVGRDRSDSVKTGCECAELLVRKALNAPEMTQGSTVTVLASGDESSADEPVLVGSYDVPKTRSVIEGRDAALKKQDKIVADLKGKCESIPVTKRSPIVLLIQRSVDRLRYQGCGPTIGCAVWVQTDGEETAEVHVKELLDGKSKNTKWAAAPLIDNSGIEIVFFGFSQTVGETETADGRHRRLTRDRSSHGAQQLRDGWSSIFTEPKRVRFEPFCTRH